MSLGLPVSLAGDFDVVQSPVSHRDGGIRRGRPDIAASTHHIQMSGLADARDGAALMDDEAPPDPTEHAAVPT